MRASCLKARMPTWAQIRTYTLHTLTYTLTCTHLHTGSEDMQQDEGSSEVGGEGEDADMAAEIRLVPQDISKSEGTYIHTHFRIH